MFARVLLSLVLLAGSAHATSITDIKKGSVITMTMNLQSPGGWIYFYKGSMATFDYALDLYDGVPFCYLTELFQVGGKYARPGVDVGHAYMQMYAGTKLTVVDREYEFNSGGSDDNDVLGGPIEVLDDDQNRYLIICAAVKTAGGPTPLSFEDAKKASESWLDFSKVEF